MLFRSAGWDALVGNEAGLRAGFGVIRVGLGSLRCGPLQPKPDSAQLQTRRACPARPGRICPLFLISGYKILLND